MRRIRIGEGDVLGVIDIQPTFMPGGELPVPNGDAVLAPINRLLGRPFGYVFATQDWHPADHASFASFHPGRAPFDVVPFPYGSQTLWPAHAIQGTLNAALHPALDADRIGLVVRKGMRREVDSYSAFRENDGASSTGLAGALHAIGARRLFLVGLALDFCVAWSAEHAVSEGFQTFVVEDASRAIAAPLGGDRTTLTEARERLASCGVVTIREADLD